MKERDFNEDELEALFAEGEREYQREERDRMWIVTWGAFFGVAFGFFLSVWGIL